MLAAIAAAIVVAAASEALVMRHSPISVAVGVERSVDLEFYQMTPCTTILVPRELQRREAEVRPPAACAGRLSRRDSLRFSPARPPRRRRAADERDELAAPHSITSSARASSLSGTVRL